MKTFRLCAWLLCSLMLSGTIVGCQKFKLLRSQSPEKLDDDEDVGEDDASGNDKDRKEKDAEREKDDKEFETKVETPLVGDYTSFAGLNFVVLEGVGLVVGLDKTGGDPPPSIYRETLVNDMRKRDVHDPESILRSQNTALVVVRAYLPPLIRKGEPFDIDVRVPKGDETTSLNGGWLLECELSEQAIVPGQGLMKGHMLARARGPVLVTSGEGKGDSTAGKLRGRILGGGVSKKDRDLRIQLRSDFRSVRQSRRIASKIGDRFFDYNEHGLREPLAKALTDQTLELKVLPSYKDNYPRYLQVIRNIAFRETSVARHVRMEKLKTQLLEPELSEQAALQLEAIGNEAIPVLKTGLKHPDLEVRFHSAMALSYLGQSDGIATLGEAAVSERAFRVYALAALSTLEEEPDARLLLRDLMSAQTTSSGKAVDSAELRYGAFRALWTLDKRDPFLNGETLKDTAARDLFGLHTLPTLGEPIIHITHNHRAEIVLFGTDQAFKTPLAVRAGPRILVSAPPGRDRVVVARYEPGQPDRRKEVSTSVAEVIRTIVEFGGSYPDVAQMLLQAAKQENIAGRIDIDALPQAGREYVRTTSASGPGKKIRVGNANLVPNFVPNLKGNESSVEKQSFGESVENESDSKEGHSDNPTADNTAAETDSRGNASLSDARAETATESSQEEVLPKRWFEFWKQK